MSSIANKICSNCPNYEFLYYDSQNEAIFRCKLDYSRNKSFHGNIYTAIKNQHCKFNE